ncbi:hypothetical protein B0T14DRAFT_283972 [Immersiella caudata]|uniref:Uncharacterized protein n=1 Tax=Immersiella caudata TaxID=314043 RepID=A0AA40BU55_9PEZI|nr:hypothetical protein B0T14DRAFT_283972 [Immersiella caudata]
MMEPPEPGDTDTASDYSSQPNFHSFPPSKCPSPQLFSASELSSTPPSHAFSTTHDASLAGYHVTQASFTTQLDLAVRAVWATRHGCKYLDVQVLLLSWESDDLGVKDKVSALESVFRDIYRFDVEWWRIPDLAPGRHATKKVIDFVEGGNSPDTLLILYYAGHAAPNPHQGGGLPCWVANRTRDSPQFDLSCVQPHLCQVDDTHPDVLLLYDSCHPANGHGSVKSGRAVIELLAATGFESIAPEVGPDSFTHCLIQELSIASRHPNGISIPELHRRQICRTQRGSQETVMMERARDGSLKVRTAGGAPMFEVPRRRTPMHCQLSRNDRPRAIVLAPLPATQAPHSTGSGFVDPDSCTGDALADHGDSKPQIHVLIRVSLAEDDLNEAQWKDWQCNAPPAVKGIKILGVLPSCSTLLLLQVPIEVWDLLPPSPAVSFVAFLSDNHSNTIPLLNESTVLGHPSQQTSVETPKNFASGKMGEKTDTEAPVNPPVELSTTDVAAPGGSALGLSNLGHYYDNGGPQHTSRVAFTASGNDKSLVNILNAVDVILPNIFRRLRTSNSIPNAKREHAVVEEVLEILTTSRSSAVIETCGNFDAKILSSPENLALLRRYIGSRDLLELDNPILNFSSRLGCLSIWLDDDARDPAAASVISATSFKSRPSSFWSKAKTVDTTSTFGEFLRQAPISPD